VDRGHPDWGQVSARQKYSETVGATLYETTITAPANTPAAAPASQDMALTKGEISWLEVRFPKGPAGLMGVAIFDSDGSTQLWPGGTATWLTGDNEVIPLDTSFVVTQTGGAYKVVLKAYNNDDTYPHAALVRLWVIPYPT
jgi:hypothetical protein